MSIADWTHWIPASVILKSMSRSDDNGDLTEEQKEAKRQRLQRARYGKWIFRGCAIAAVVAAFWIRDYPLTVLFMAGAMVGAGFSPQWKMPR